MIISIYDIENNKSEGQRFLDSLHEVMAFACRKILDEDLKFQYEDAYTYSEVFEHFEYVMERLKPFSELMNFYERIDPRLLTYAINEDIDMLDLSSLSIGHLRGLSAKIDDELRKREGGF